MRITAARAACTLATIASLAGPCGPAVAEEPAPAPLLTDVDHRTTWSLDGVWRTIVDPYETGYYDYRYQPKKDGFFLDQKARDETDRVEYDFDTSDPLFVPGDWNTQRDSLLFYEGTIWYRRLFDDPRHDRSSRLFLWFGGAASHAHVFLNGALLGAHEGGFTPFDFEITSRLKATGNSLVVKVDNQRRPDAVPTLDFDWWNYGGITRRVLLVEVKATFVRDYSLQLARGGDRLAGFVQLDGPEAAGRTVSVRVPEAGLEQQATTDATGRAEIGLPAPGISRWSPTSPKLYDVVVEAGPDTLHDEVGFRTVQTRGTRILLNGRPVFLRGVCAHEEAPFRSGRAWSGEDARTLLGWVKELHGDFVRLAHYPHNERMLREADRMGVLVWSEIPVYWAIRWDDPATLESARRQLTESITRDRNRASIVLWSVGNETPVSEARNGFLRSLVETARALDPTRLVTAALERGTPEGDTQVIDDPLGRSLDVLGCNEYVGWYDGLPEKLDRVSWRSAYDKPLVMSEWGAGARYGLHGKALSRWSEEFQEDVYRRQVAMLSRIPFLAGTSPWILMDFRSPHRVLPGIQDGWNRKGVVSDRGERKKAFYVLQEWYRALEEREERAAAP
jgi:beta-glucuronidase